MKEKTLTELDLLTELNANVKKLLAIVATQGADDARKIIMLQKMGYTSTQISEMSGIPERTVRDKWTKSTKPKIMDSKTNAK
jgi:hypothetical protein